jgi:hypothetical protein
MEIQKKLLYISSFMNLRFNTNQEKSGYSSVVERHLAKVHVARSTRVTRYILTWIGLKNSKSRNH